MLSLTAQLCLSGLALPGNLPVFLADTDPLCLMGLR